MISVVTAYYNRKRLFVRTLESIKRHYGKINFEVIAVDDGSDEQERLEDLQYIYPFLRVIRLEKENKWYVNSCIPFNIGFSQVKGDKIIIQNPECFHADSILEYVENNLVDNHYLSFGCYSLDKTSTDGDQVFLENGYLENLIYQNNRAPIYDGDLGWYNNSIHRSKAYHFCSALTTNDLFDLGGFDERFAKGIGYDDDEFVWRVKRKMKIDFIDDHIVLHQNHYTSINPPTQEECNQKESQYKRNRMIFEEITRCSHQWKANYLDNTFIKTDYSVNKVNNNHQKFNEVINRFFVNKYFQKIRLKLFICYKKFR